MHGEGGGRVGFYEVELFVWVWSEGVGAIRGLQTLKKHLINQNKPLSPHYFFRETREEMGTGL